VVLYSDHLIVNIEKFVTSLKKAIALTANFDHIVTIGTRPTSPVCDFGYIEMGKQLGDDHLFMIDSFHEKPSRELAESFLKQGNYLWNTGVYVWSTNTLLKKIKEVQPHLYESLLELRIAINTPSFSTTVEEWYKTIPPKAFEKSITEKLDDMCVYEADYEWLDVGNWKTVYTISKKNHQGNAVLESPHSEVSFIESTNCLVYGHSKRIGVIGLENVIIVETDQELLICHQDKAAKVKDLVNGWDEPEK
jgi:mannose-1-phosphate guanylyltransferase